MNRISVMYDDDDGVDMEWVTLYSPEISNEWDRYGRCFLYEADELEKLQQGTHSLSMRRTSLPLTVHIGFSFNLISTRRFFLRSSDFVRQQRRSTHIHQFQPKSLKPNHFKVGLGMFNCKCNTAHFPRTEHIYQRQRRFAYASHVAKNGKQFFRIRRLMNFLLSLMFVLNTEIRTHTLTRPAFFFQCIQIITLSLSEMLFSF